MIDCIPPPLPDNGLYLKRLRCTMDGVEDVFQWVNMQFANRET
jgi:hypothetical protein